MHTSLMVSPMSLLRISARLLLLLLTATSCGDTKRERRKATAERELQSTIAAADAGLPLSRDTLEPAIVTDKLPGDSDDPAIWVSRTADEPSVVLGTDKGDVTGGVYTFDLAGHVVPARSVAPLLRMNNVDVEYGFRAGRKLMDIAVATERKRNALRVFSMPDMRPIDGGGIIVFDGNVERAPMGIALYRRPRDGQVFAFVGGKTGPLTGYIAQYRLTFANGRVTGTKVREFGAYSGRKEIESIAVDDALGYVYYSDEGAGVRKYQADPDSSSRELALFATRGVREDHEGLAIYARDSTRGYLVLSDQGAGRIQLFPREGTEGNAHAHPLLAAIPVRARETDGLDVTARAVSAAFPHGMLAMMSNRGRFHFYRWDDVQTRIDAVLAARP